MTFTRGPLKLKPAEFGSDKDIGIVKVENNGNLSLLAEVYEIVNSSGRKADVKANARMFAAAPEMLKGLKRAEQTIRNLAANLDGDLAQIASNEAINLRDDIDKAGE